MQPEQRAPRLDITLDYHQLSKHRFDAYAPGPETLDWDNQPNPFRFYQGAPGYSLDPFSEINTASLAQMLDNSDIGPTAQELNPTTLSAFFRSSFALSAWKQYGPDQWSLRVNPSSGNLHPTEVYTVFGPSVADLAPGLYHYRADQHQLEKRGSFSDPPEQLGNGFVLAFSSVQWRESWKYGERGFRYCQLDLGHAMAAAAMAARSLGWRSYWLPQISQSLLSQSLGLNHPSVETVRAEEREQADCCLYIATRFSGHSEDSGKSPSCSKVDNFSWDQSAVVTALQQIRHWQGTPNGLGEKTFYRWPHIKAVAGATAYAPRESLTDVQNSRGPRELYFARHRPMPLPDNYSLPFHQLAKQRRSAQRFLRQGMSRDRFIHLINSLYWGQQALITGPDADGAVIHFVLAIHEVDQVTPGLYLLAGCGDDPVHLPSDIAVDGHLDTPLTELLPAPLYRLKTGNLRSAVATLCCQQAIAADCNFTIGFLARFEQPLRQQGADLYPRLYWQAGGLSQQVYMAATGLNMAATGIGCFFDDPWHDVLGIADLQYQLIYQMAVGSPLVDERIASFSGYHFLRQQMS